MRDPNKAKTREEYLLERERRLLLIFESRHKTIDQSLTFAFLMAFLVTIIAAGSTTKITAFGLEITADKPTIILYASLLLIAIYCLVNHDIIRINALYQAIDSNSKDIISVNAWALPTQARDVRLSASGIAGLVVALTDSMANLVRGLDDIGQELLAYVIRAFWARRTPQRLTKRAAIKNASISVALIAAILLYLGILIYLSVGVVVMSALFCLPSAMLFYASTLLGEPSGIDWALLYGPRLLLYAIIVITLVNVLFMIYYASPAVHAIADELGGDTDFFQARIQAVFRRARSPDKWQNPSSSG